VRRDSLAAKPRGIFQTVDELMAAKTWGRGHMPIICREAERLSGFDQEALSDYYRHLCFDLGAAEQCGLRHFFSADAHVSNPTGGNESAGGENIFCLKIRVDAHRLF